MLIVELVEVVAALQARIEKLEEALLDHKQQMRFQLTKDAQLARDLGKKK
jgi:hypothetical protein